MELGEQQWDETQQQMARALQARRTGAVNKGLNDKRLGEIILTNNRKRKQTYLEHERSTSKVNNNKMETCERKN